MGFLRICLLELVEVEYGVWSWVGRWGGYWVDRGDSGSVCSWGLVKVGMIVGRKKIALSSGVGAWGGG